MSGTTKDLPLRARARSHQPSDQPAHIPTPTLAEMEHQLEDKTPIGSQDTASSRRLINSLPLWYQHAVQILSNHVHRDVVLLVLGYAETRSIQSIFVNGSWFRFELMSPCNSIFDIEYHTQWSVGLYTPLYFVIMKSIDEKVLALPNPTSAIQEWGRMLRERIYWRESGIGKQEWISILSDATFLDQLTQTEYFVLCQHVVIGFHEVFGSFEPHRLSPHQWQELCALTFFQRGTRMWETLKKVDVEAILTGAFEYDSNLIAVLTQKWQFQIRETELSSDGSQDLGSSIECKMLEPECLPQEIHSDEKKAMEPDFRCLPVRQLHSNENPTLAPKKGRLLGLDFGLGMAFGLSLVAGLGLLNPWNGRR